MKACAIASLLGCPLADGMAVVMAVVSDEFNAAANTPTTNPAGGPRPLLAKGRRIADTEDEYD